jgi:hypothetical protein
MKTAISIPDAVFMAAERQAQRTRKSRSQLYAEAMAEYLCRHSPDEVTEAMNQALVEVGEAIDPFVQRSSRKVLEETEW